MSNTGENKMSDSDSSEKDIFDQIINHSRSMISIINRNYIYVKVNATFCQEHQIINDSIVGKSLADVWGEDIFSNNIKSKVDKCFAGETISYEASFNTPRLGQRYYEVVFRPLASGKPGIAHIMAETFDIHELRLSRQEALDKEEELRKIESNLPVGFIRCDPDGNLIQANDAFLRIMECPSDIPVRKMNLKNFYPVEVLFDIQIEQLIEFHSKTFGRIFLMNWNGDEIPCRISGFLAVDRSDRPSYIDFAIEDSSRELMLENKLLQAQKLETIGSLAGGIAHDFNNILAIISGYSEMLLEDLPKILFCQIMSAKSRGLYLKLNL
ncbi:MAG: PAS domain-containing protein [Bacteroidales bacterium]|nr:PAS domain-containing protein [Bacteroidales bacterium]